MIVIESSVATTAKPEVIWNRWIDLASWKQWNISVISSSLKGGFRLGSTGEICMKNAQNAAFEVTFVQPDKGFDLMSHVWGGTLTFQQRIESVGGVQRISVAVIAEGWLSFIYGYSMRYALKNELPACLTQLALLVEADQAQAEQEIHDARFKNN